MSVDKVNSSSFINCALQQREQDLEEFWLIGFNHEKFCCLLSKKIGA